MLRKIGQTRDRRRFPRWGLLLLQQELSAGIYGPFIARAQAIMSSDHERMTPRVSGSRGAIASVSIDMAIVVPVDVIIVGAIPIAIVMTLIVVVVVTSTGKRNE